MRRNPTYRVVVVNGRHLRQSPHLHSNPTERSNPPPSVLHGENLDLWNRAHAVAGRYYEGAWDYPEHSAWRSLKLARPELNGTVYSTQHTTTPPEEPMKLPDPGKMIPLGRALEYVAIDDPGKLDVYRFKNDENAPMVLWSKPRKMLVILPNAKVPKEHDPDLTGLEDLSRLYRDFHWGQQPRGFTTKELEDWTLHPVGMGDTLVYRSGKGTPVRDDPPGVQEYIHQHGDGVVVYQGPDPKNPEAIVLMGGDLDVEEAGIVN